MFNKENYPLSDYGIKKNDCCPLLLIHTEQIEAAWYLTGVFWHTASWVSEVATMSLISLVFHHAGSPSCKHALQFSSVTTSGAKAETYQKWIIFEVILLQFSLTGQRAATKVHRSPWMAQYPFQSLPFPLVHSIRDHMHIGLGVGFVWWLIEERPSSFFYSHLHRHLEIKVQSRNHTNSLYWGGKELEWVMVFQLSCQKSRTTCQNR